MLMFLPDFLRLVSFTIRLSLIGLFILGALVSSRRRPACERLGEMPGRVFISLVTPGLLAVLVRVRIFERVVVLVWAGVLSSFWRVTVRVILRSALGASGAFLTVFLRTGLVLCSRLVTVVVVLL